MRVNAPRIGVISVSLAGERIDLCPPFEESLAADLERSGFDVIRAAEVALGADAVIEGVRELGRRGAAVILYAIGTWIDPPMVVRAAQACGLPSVLVANPAPASFGFTGASAVHGALDRLALPHRIQLGGPDGEGWETSVLAFARAVAVAQGFRRSTYGLFGGQTPGQYTGSVDLLEARDTFGLEIGQIDELAIVDRARAMDDERALEVGAHLAHDYGGVDGDPDALLRSIKLRLALEEELRERDLTFASVKCLGETIQSYASFCVAASLLNDADRTISCQGDVPTTIVMEALRQLSGEPGFFADLIRLDPKRGAGRLGNCGVRPVSLAARPRDIRWLRQYDYMGAGGGVTSSFCTRPGRVTVAAMTRIQKAFAS